MNWYTKAKTTSARLVGILIVLTSGQAWAASNVTISLELGGDNHSASWEAGTPAFFTNGSTANGQTFPLGSTITWGARVSASGTQAAGNGAGSPIYGVANFVFDLEIHQGSATGALATAATFFSSINDGDADGGANDILAAAAFALVFNQAGCGPGSVVDPQCSFPPPGWPVAAVWTPGGANCGGRDSSADRLKSANYPTASPGKLTGMGAGYNVWMISGSTKTAKGIGMATLPNGQPGLGVLTLAEGQIGTSGMTTGTYVIVINPGGGNNVLRGDIDLNQPQNAFATAADTTTHDQPMTFTLVLPVPPAAPSIPSPADGATCVPVTTLLCWTVGVGATSHDVYFGTSVSPPFVQNQATTCYDPPGNLAYNTTYYWQINEVNGTGTTPGPVWLFTTAPLPPGLPTNPNPADSATGVAVTTAVSWTAGAGATSHDVYFGTAVSPPFIGNQAGTSYDPPGDLAPLTLYYWKIVEKNACNVATAGPVWSFTTADGGPSFSATAWRSVRTHSGCGECSIVLNPAAIGTGTSGPTSETRNGGVQKIEIDFTAPVQLLGEPGFTGNDPNNPTPYPAFLINGDQTLVLTFDPPGQATGHSLTNGYCYTVDLSGDVILNMDFESLTGDVDCKFRNLIGDVNGNGSVTLGDTLAIKAKVSAGEPVFPNNCRYDINLSCTLTLSDMLGAKGKVPSSACP